MNALDRHIAILGMVEAHLPEIRMTYGMARAGSPVQPERRLSSARLECARVDHAAGSRSSDGSGDPFTDPTKTGIFRDHHCSVCNDGEKPCREGRPGLCGNPRAMND